MDPASCREHLAALLTQECNALEKLASLLEHEHGLLVANDIEALEKAMAERQGCVGILLRIEEERRALCRALGHSADASGLERVLAWCDPSGTLRSRWAECASRGARCRDLNDRNGALVLARMKRVESLLGALTGAASDASTYGPAGTTNGPAPAGRVLAIRA